MMQFVCSLWLQMKRKLIVNNKLHTDTKLIYTQKMLNTEYFKYRRGRLLTNPATVSFVGKDVKEGYTG